MNNLQLQPRWRLISAPVGERPSHPGLAIRGVVWRPLADEISQVLFKVVVGSEATYAQGHEDPSSRVRGLTFVVCQLLANLTVNLSSAIGKYFIRIRTQSNYIFRLEFLGQYFLFPSIFFLHLV